MYQHCPEAVVQGLARETPDATRCAICGLLAGISSQETPAATGRRVHEDAAVGGHHRPREGQQTVVVLLGLPCR